MYNPQHPLTTLERDPGTGQLLLRSFTPDRDFSGFSPTDTRPVKTNPERGGTVYIIGGGVGGLATAYDLLKQNQNRRPEHQFQVFILEAEARLGGRSITLRPGDSFTEHVPTPDGKDFTPVTQTLKFHHEKGEAYPPYLNAGPGRIPSGHKHVLDLCQELGVDLEVYVMETRSNLLWTKKGFQHLPAVNGQVVNDVRGYIAEELFQQIAGQAWPPESPEGKAQQEYLALLRYFGALTEDQETGEVSYQGSQRSGYVKLPGLQPGVHKKPLPKAELLKANLPARSIYQAEDFLWQQTSFQPVGGMDKIVQALEREVRRLALESQWSYDPILLEAPVIRIRKTPRGWQIYYQGMQRPADADFCIVNMPLQLLGNVVLERDFSAEYWKNLHQVMEKPGFFRPTCKVGWQAERALWQNPTDPNAVPIYGGISRIEHPMTQMWYPSNRFQDRLGVLTGAYNYEQQASDWGQLMPDVRVDQARDGAKKLHGEAFGNALQHGISIAWQNMPYLGGGWPNWAQIIPNTEPNAEAKRAAIMNTIRKGENGFHVVGDQVSFWPGWKEGAVMAALEVFAKVTEVEGFSLPEFIGVPDTTDLVQGHTY